MKKSLLSIYKYKLAKKMLSLANGIQKYASMLQLVALIIAGTYTLYQYKESLHQGRVEASLKYAELFNSGEIFKSRSALDLIWLEESNLEMLQKYQANRSDPNAFSELKNLVWESVRNNKHEVHVYRLASFFGDIAACAKRNRCDWETTCQLFYSGARNFFQFHIKFISDWEASWNTPVGTRITEFYWQCEELFPYLEHEAKS